MITTKDSFSSEPLNESTDEETEIEDSFSHEETPDEPLNIVESFQTDFDEDFEGFE